VATMAEWAERLAREVAPDEQELAPLMAEAYAAGGAARAELFARNDPVPGGFGAGEMGTVIPLVFQSMVAAAPLLLSALSSNIVGDLLGCVKTGLSMAEVRAKAQSARGAVALSGAGAAVATVPAAAAYAPLKRVIDTMAGELQAQGLSADQSDLITFRVLRQLLDQPQDAAQFVGHLAGPSVPPTMAP
jgi:hypothetical protein